MRGCLCCGNEDTLLSTDSVSLTIRSFDKYDFSPLQPRTRWQDIVPYKKILESKEENTDVANIAEQDQSFLPVFCILAESQANLGSVPVHYLYA